jgi:hypothetical protein
VSAFIWESKKKINSFFVALSCHFTTSVAEMYDAKNNGGADRKTQWAQTQTRREKRCRGSIWKTSYLFLLCFTCVWCCCLSFLKQCYHLVVTTF